MESHLTQCCQGGRIPKSVTRTKKQSEGQQMIFDSHTKLTCQYVTCRGHNSFSSWSDESGTSLSFLRKRQTSSHARELVTRYFTKMIATYKMLMDKPRKIHRVKSLLVAASLLGVHLRIFTVGLVQEPIMRPLLDDLAFFDTSGSQVSKTCIL